MTISDSRRIRNIRLKASHRDLIRRGVIVLEDAFRTATLTGTGGRLLLVRSFDVGRFHARQTSTSVARAIEQRFRNLQQTAVYAAAPHADRFDAVYFHDDTEPYVLLAVRLARGETPRAWFWPLAAAPWTPKMDRSTALPALLARTLQTSPRTAAAVRLIRELQQHRAIDPLLASLGPGDGDVLLRAFGWPSSIDPAVQGAAALDSRTEPSPQWEATLRRWIARWGPSDLRTRWLSAVALVAEKPARLLARDIVQRAQRVIHQLAQDSFSVGIDAVRVSPTSDEATALDVPNAESSSVDPAAGKAVAERDIDGELALSDRADLPDRDDTQIRHRVPDPVDSADQRVHNADQRTDSVANQRVDSADQTVNVVRKETADGEPDEPFEGGDSEEQLDRSARQPARGLNVADRQTPGAFRQQAAGTAADANQQDPPLHSENAGLFFSVTVLSYLGIEEFLAADADWIEAEFPFRFFPALCGQLGIAADDPALRAFTAPGDSLPDGPGRFVPPTAWHSTWWNDERWYPCDGCYPRERVIEIWIEAVRRWCLDQVEMELDEIVQRPGQVSWTPTHIDVVFDPRQADVRIRKAGLDLNPGWVPWLGRVINYHYG